MTVSIELCGPLRAAAPAGWLTLDALKHRAPNWKLEHYLDGDSGWVPGHTLCQHA